MPGFFHEGLSMLRFLFSLALATAMMSVSCAGDRAAAQVWSPVTVGKLPHVAFNMVLPPGFCLAEKDKSDYEAEYLDRMAALVAPHNTLIAFLLPCQTIRAGRDDSVSEVARPTHWITILATNEAPGKPRYLPDGKLDAALDGYAAGVAEALRNGPFAKQLLKDKAKELPHMHDFEIHDEEHAFGARDAHGVYFAGAVTKLNDGKRVATMSMTAMTFLYGYSVTVNAYAPTGDVEARSKLLGQAMIPMRNLRNYTQAAR
ncbi:MAG: hypothetical protein ACRCTD_01855 [Beijerinckiaceae bacterium]